MATAKGIELTKLKYKKQASLTRLETYINSLENNKFDLDELKIRVGKLEETYKGFTDVQIEIAAIDDAIEEADLCIESEDVENKYIQIRVAAKKLLNSKLDISVNEEAERTVVEDREVIANNNERTSTRAQQSSKIAEN